MVANRIKKKNPKTKEEPQTDEMDHLVSKLRGKHNTLETEEQEEIKEHHKAHPVLVTLAIIIPLIVLGIILYMNYLPFGYEKTFVIDVGTEGDTSGTFYLEQSSALGARQLYDEKYFRAVDGVVNVVFEPDPILRNVSIKVEIEGDNVYFIKPGTNLEWDYDFVKDYEDLEVVAPHTLYNQFLSGQEVDKVSGAFAIKINYNSTIKEKVLSGDIEIVQDAKQIVVSYENNKTPKQIKYNLPDFYIGTEHEVLVGYNKENMYLFVDGIYSGKNIANKIDVNKVSSSSENITFYSKYNNTIKERIEKDENDCLVFDGKTRLVYPNSSDKFEEGPFAVYVEWKPESSKDNQQIIGHFNWGIWQNDKSVSFRVGRMYNNGPSYELKYEIEDEFFGKIHNVLATYIPLENESGYIELFVDGSFARRIEFGNETIWSGYGVEDLSMGWTPHNYQKSPHYIGSVCDAKFSYKQILPEKRDNIELNITEIDDSIKIPIFGKGSLEKIKLIAVKRD